MEWRLGGLCLLLAMVVASLVLPSRVAADSVSSQFTVTATVPPARIIIIDEQHQIRQILSNTDLSVTPKVYLGSERGPIAPYTAVLDRQYQLSMALTRHHIGQIAVVPLPNLASPAQSSLALRGMSMLASWPWQFAAATLRPRLIVSPHVGDALAM